MGLWTDIVGSVRGYIRLGLTGARLKNSSGALAVRNAGDSSYADVECALLKLGGVSNAWGAANADIASAATLDLTAATGSVVRITGTTATSSVTLNNGQMVVCVAVGAWPLTHHATNFPLPGSANYTCAAGDLVICWQDNSGVKHVQIRPVSGMPVADVLGGAIAFPADITPAQITADQNDYNPTGLSTASTLRLSTDAARDVTGIQGGADGRVLVLHNVGTNNIVLKDESASSTAANRFALNADVTLGADQAAVLQYDATSSRWRLLAGPGGGSGSSVNVQVFASSGTWTKPAGCTSVLVELLGAGGGGASGERRAAGQATIGGGGGGGGAYNTAVFIASALGATESVTVGAGGPGGTAVSTDTTAGNTGSAGGNTTFGSFLTAYGGGGGAANLGSGHHAGGGGGGRFSAGATATSSGTGGTPNDYQAAYGKCYGGANGGTSTTESYWSMHGGGGGGSTQASGSSYSSGGGSYFGGGGGGSGGGITSANAATSPLGGGRTKDFSPTGGGGAAGASSNTNTATAGGNGAEPAGWLSGGGGGGGGSNKTAASMSGGNGGRGGGGGGGGASRNGYASGAGGAGGNGYVRITSW